MLSHIVPEYHTLCTYGCCSGAARAKTSVPHLDALAATAHDASVKFRLLVHSVSSVLDFMVWVTQTFALATWCITVQAALIPHAVVAAAAILVLFVVVAYLDQTTCMNTTDVLAWFTGRARHGVAMLHLLPLAICAATFRCWVGAFAKPRAFAATHLRAH